MPPGEDEEAPHRGKSPRVLFGERAECDGPSSARNPTTPRVLFGTPVPPRSRTDAPRIVGGGEVRRRIPCTLSDLQDMDPRMPEALLRDAIRLIDAVNLDDNEFEDVVRFGAVLQQRHGRLSEEQLAVLGDETLAEVKRLGSDLLQNIEALDPATVFAPRPKLLGRLRDVAFGHDAEEAFRRHYGSISTITRELKARTPEIAKLSSSILSLNKRYKSLEYALSTHLVAARYLLRHIETGVFDSRSMEQHYKSQASAIETRITSLSATAASVSLASVTLDATIAVVSGIERFATALIEEELPAWHTAYSAALAARASGSDRPAAELSRLQLLHENIRNTLFRKDPS